MAGNTNLVSAYSFLSKYYPVLILFFICFSLLKKNPYRCSSNANANTV